MDPSLYDPITVSKRRIREQKREFLINYLSATETRMINRGYNRARKNYLRRKNKNTTFTKAWKFYNVLAGKPPGINYQFVTSKVNFIVWLIRHEFYWGCFYVFTKLF